MSESRADKSRREAAQSTVKEGEEKNETLRNQAEEEHRLRIELGRAHSKIDEAARRGDRGVNLEWDDTSRYSEPCPLSVIQKLATILSEEEYATSLTTRPIDDFVVTILRVQW
jgi:CRISPR/Cas system-associated exonuclease Cas4 (RecB family)